MRLTLDHPALAAGQGTGVRVAVIDSGIAVGHPHVGDVAPGIWITPEGTSEDTADRIGHGTAVAAAIREKAPGAVLVPIRVFDRDLSTTASIIARAVATAVDLGVSLINLSVGTSNEAHRALFQRELDRAADHGVFVVAAYAVDGQRRYPGALPGAVGVVDDRALPRDAIAVTLEDGAIRCSASPFPRPVPGVPVERNLAGVSFAVANVTGVLARVLETMPVGDTLGRRLLSLTTTDD